MNKNKKAKKQEKKEFKKENQKYIKNKTINRSIPHKEPLQGNEILVAENLWKIIINGNKRFDIIKDVSLVINKSEFVMIFGESGSGKTSLISMLSALERPSEGNVNINDYNTACLKQSELTKLRKKQIGYIFQQYGLLSDLTVLENIIITCDSRTQSRIIKKNNKFKKWESDFIKSNKLLFNYNLNSAIHHTEFYNYLLKFDIAYFLKSNLNDTSYDFQYILSIKNEIKNILYEIIDKKRDEYFNNEYIYEIIKQLDIDKLINKKVILLSGGQQQRVSISRAIAKKPNILFADEPTGAVDSATAKVIMKLFSQLNKEFNTTVIMVTHNKNLSPLATRNIIIADGKVISDNANHDIKNIDEINFE